MTKRAEAKDLYLSALRGDAAAQRKCTAMGKQCGGRCIPKHWNCRLKGEGEEPPTRGNKVELTPEVRARLKARRSAKRNSTLRKVAGLAALTAGAAGVGALAARRGISSGNVTGAASTAAGLITAANPAAALPGALAAAGAGMGARLYQQGQRVERFKTQIRGLSGRLNANLNRIRQYEREIGANERKLSSLMTQIANSQSQRDMRKLRAEADTVLKMLDRDKRRMKNLRESAPRTQALIERATRRAQPTVGKVLRAAVSEVNQASSTGRSIRSQRGAFRRNFGLTGSGKPGPKPTDWLDRYTNLDASEERTDKKCGESGIAENKKCTKGTGKGRQVAKAAATAALVAGGAVALRQAAKAGVGKTKATQGAKGPWVASKGRRMTPNEIEALRRMRERGQGKYGAQPRRRTGDEVEHHGETFSGYNQPKRTPSHPRKSHAVLAKEGETVKLIRFGQQGVQGSPPKEGESKAYASRRRAWKARHAENIAKGKMSAAYWANRAKWDAAGEQRLGKPCGASHIPKLHTCHKNAAESGQNWQKAAMIVGAVAGGAVLAHELKRRSGEWWKDHKWDEPFDEEGFQEAKAAKRTWDAFEQRKAGYEAACARGDEAKSEEEEVTEQLTLEFPAGKLRASARNDGWREAKTCRGGGAFGKYYVHSSGKYGYKSFTDEDYDSQPEADMLEHANRIGVPSPRLINYTGKVMQLEHLRGYKAIGDTNFGMGVQFGRNIPTEIKKNFIAAVRAMHVEGMAHNDLHMGNVMVGLASRRVKLLDFGMASLRSDSDSTVPFNDARGSRLLRDELESIPYKLNIGETAANLVQRRYKNALQLVEDIADAEQGYGRARNKSGVNLHWDTAEFIINRYYNDLTRIVESQPDQTRSRSVTTVVQPRIPGFDKARLKARWNTRQAANLYDGLGKDALFDIAQQMGVSPTIFEDFLISGKKRS